MNPAELFRHDSDGIELAKGETLFHEGDRGDCMYVLLEGSADVRVGETLVESATPGALLGEMALVDSSPRTATVVATEPCRLAKIDQRRFHFLVQQTPYFATHVMKVLTERLRHMNLRTKSSSVA
jgi:CRP/FNR family transcriptional regulator, cyclic AMP receptor protein